MSRRHARAALGHLAALLPHGAPAVIDDELIDKWEHPFGSIDPSCEGDVDELTTALLNVASTWEGDEWPSPGVVASRLSELRKLRVRGAAVAAARAACASSSVPSLTRPMPSYSRRTA